MSLPDYPFESNFHLLADKTRLHYIDEGEGEVIVMVHGNPTWSYFYRRCISLLSKKYRVIAVDHIGCGLSDKPSTYSYTLEQHRNNLYDLLETLNIKKYSLMVHDWGGAIGVGCAALSPDRLQKMVVLNTAAFRAKRIPARISLCRIPFFGELIVRGFNGFAFPATFMAVSKKMDKGVKEAFLSPYNNWQNRIATHRFVMDIPLTESHPSYQTLCEVEAGLNEIASRKLPTLILWGGKDFCFNDHFYKEWCERLPHAEKVYYENGNHYILEDEFDDIKSKLSGFFELQP